MKVRHIHFGVLVALACFNVALAHDFWIEPSTFWSKVQDLIEVRLRVGHVGEGEPVARNAQRIEKFIVAGPSGQNDVPGQDGKDPAGLMRPAEDGLHVLGYRSNHASIELEAEKFEAYLKEEGLDRIIELRKERGETAEKAREIYSRCAKALVQIGEKPAGASESAFPPDRMLGFQLELVAQKCPFDLKPGDELPLQLLFDSKPCEGVLIAAKNHQHPHGAVSARTDKDGKAALKITSAGPWLITAVHMIEAPAGSNAQWESLWASLTFELRKTPAP
ncbi:MAG: DUF4198 domain-containing protein [Phycisphaerales bacterium]|nr:DUF4198 domain-containing protein [Phycisphaerales bacterium]MCI0632004.1 DUF4198 domain-containing protein [Phycisphaerales bacterium]MCI0677123.1 DUF4198 domain-containing protein [Phycisphaerales bacterium]